MSNVVRLEYAYGVCPKCKRVHYLRYLIHNDGLIHKPYEIKCVNCNSYFAKEDIFGSREETVQKPTTNGDRANTDQQLRRNKMEYVKIPNIYKREEFGKNRLIEGMYSRACGISCGICSK